MLKKRSSQAPRVQGLGPRRDVTVEGGKGTSGEKEEDKFAGDDYYLKVADFGLSRVEGIPVKKYVHEAVTLWYRSPDVLLGNTNYSYSVDAWSLGCIIVEIMSGAAPFRGKDESDQLKRILSRLGGPTRSDPPGMMAYPHSETYEAVLESMVLYHEKEKENGTFTAKEAQELKHLLERVPLGAPPPSSTQATPRPGRCQQSATSPAAGEQAEGWTFWARRPTWWRDCSLWTRKKRLSVLEAVQHPFMRLPRRKNSTKSTRLPATGPVRDVRRPASRRGWQRRAYGAPPPAGQSGPREVAGAHRRHQQSLYPTNGTTAAGERRR
ncbi:cyclin-dependent kinase 2 homolog [Bactrocera neohumeralis]|uniref:cyclin-dependent kinase 2 homolog n=1 Tax=Bactrocera neohumeralis TaxID=98809 RepID=UPI0021660B54|nr:cyclin-dependent kinase 2 homolog [Bactrocera neohumeralis]